MHTGYNEVIKVGGLSQFRGKITFQAYKSNYIHTDYTFKISSCSSKSRVQNKLHYCRFTAIKMGKESLDH